MNRFLRKEKDSVFSFALSIFVHIFIISFIIIPYAAMLNAIQNENKRIEEFNENETVFLIETPDVPEEKNDENTKFVSDKELLQKGDDTKKPNIFITDSSIFSVLRDPNSSSMRQRQAPNSGDSGDGQSITSPDMDTTKIELYKPERPTEKSDVKIPSSFDEGADRAIVYSSETGQIQLGTKSQEYFWYFYSLINAIRGSWYKALPNQAHYLGLIRTDSVEVLLSIDENGNIAFEKFLKTSVKGQVSLDNSCSKAIEYAGKLNPPPVGLLRDYAENGKIYIPFRFLYQNFSE